MGEAVNNLIAKMAREKEEQNQILENNKSEREKREKEFSDWAKRMEKNVIKVAIDEFKISLEKADGELRSPFEGKLKSTLNMNDILKPRIPVIKSSPIFEYSFEFNFANVPFTLLIKASQPLIIFVINSTSQNYNRPQKFEYKINEEISKEDIDEQIANCIEAVLRSK